jgi:hypothetical protein
MVDYNESISTVPGPIPSGSSVWISLTEMPGSSTISGNYFPASIQDLGGPDYEKQALANPEEDSGADDSIIPDAHCSAGGCRRKSRLEPAPDYDQLG